MDVAVEFNTLSKSHNMAGWRIGAALGNREVLRNLYTLKTNVDSSHFLAVLDAATEAMQGDQSWLVRRNEVYRQRRDVLLAGLQRLGLQADRPLGSLYVWSRIPEGWSSMDFVSEALEQAHVSLTPGAYFGRGGEGFVRIALTAPVERIEEAVSRLERWLPR
jgi:LL-diaminopimelate aminotransferase